MRWIIGIYIPEAEIYTNYITKGHNDYGNSNFNSIALTLTVQFAN